MRIEKEKRRVNIVCTDGFLIKGFVHLSPGQRILDFINDPKRDYIPVTVVEIYYIKEARFLKLEPKLLIKKDVVILNTKTIKWIEEINE